MREMASSSSLLLCLLCAVAYSCSFSSALNLNPILNLNASLAGSPDPFSCPNIVPFSSLKTAPLDNGTLRLVVPWKAGFKRFVTFWPHNCTLTGFCVEVFNAALQHLHDPRVRNFRYVILGDGNVTPVYNQMIELVRNKTVDGVVADLTITRDRSQIVGFTMPYLASYLVMITPLRYTHHQTIWDFLRPFSQQLWATLVLCFLVTGFLIYFLEDKNPEFSTTLNKKGGLTQRSTHGGSSLQYAPTVQPSTALKKFEVQVQSLQESYNNHFEEEAVYLQSLSPLIYDEASHMRRILNAFWFTSLSVFEAQRESVRTHLGRIAAVMWFFAALIFNSSYTASLTSMLSALQSIHSPAIAGFQALLSDNSIPIGCQESSFMGSYMNKLNLMNHVIKKYTVAEQYIQGLHEGDRNGVGAVLMESPYTPEVLESHCDLTKTSRADDNLPYFGGFGFAFRHGDALIDEVSKVIIQMAENGTLKMLRERWHVGDDDTQKGCGSGGGLEIKCFGGLFISGAAVYVFCAAWRLPTAAITSSKWRKAVIPRLPLHSPTTVLRLATPRCWVQGLLGTRGRLWPVIRPLMRSNHGG